MYNQEVKIRFIREYTQSMATESFAVTVFNLFAPYEEGWEADLCTRTTEELQVAADAVLSMRIQSQMQQLRIISAYCKWCVLNGVPGATDGGTHIAFSGMDKMRMRMVSGPVHLQKYLDEVFPPVENETVSIVYRCYYWMAFAGIKETDVLSVKCADVDLSDLVIRFGGKEYDLYREAIPTFRLATTLTSFNYFHENPTYVARRERRAGDALIRGIKPLESLKSLQSAMGRPPKEAFETGKTRQRLTYRNVMLSGLFYRVYENERSGIPHNFADIVAEKTEGKEYATSRGMSKKQILKQIENRYLEDYQRWKFVFFTT